jgi:hypothetical protein
VIGTSLDPGVVHCCIEIPFRLLLLETISSIASSASDWCLKTSVRTLVRGWLMGLVVKQHEGSQVDEVSIDMPAEYITAVAKATVLRRNNQ